MNINHSQFLQAFPNLDAGQRVLLDALLAKAFPERRVRKSKDVLAEVEKEARRLMAAGQLIPAVKYLREASRDFTIGTAMTARYGYSTPLGLAEAKWYAEKFPRGNQ